MRLRHKISSHGKKSRVSAVTIFKRHEEKSAITSTNLTKKGIEKSRRFLDEKKFLIKAYHSGVTRAASTVKFVLEGVGAANKSHSKPRVRRDLHYHALKGTAALDRQPPFLDSNHEAAFVRNWLDGKIPNRLIGSPNNTADTAIKKRLGLMKRAVRMGKNNFVLLNVTHGWILEAILERLTGKKLIRSGKDLIKQGESIRIYSTEDNKSYLDFRGKRYDITTRLSRILEAKRRDP